MSSERNHTPDSHILMSIDAIFVSLPSARCENSPTVTGSICEIGISVVKANKPLMGLVTATVPCSDIIRYTFQYGNMKKTNTLSNYE